MRAIALGYLAFGGLLLAGGLTFATLGLLVLSGALSRGGGPPLGLCVTEAVFMTSLATLCWIAAWALWTHRFVLFIQIVAGLVCILFPFGTLLGALTFVWLERPDVRSLFARPLAR